MRQDALFWLYAALFVVTGAIAARRRTTLGAIGLPWLSALIQLGVVAYMFAPEPFRKPPVTAALFLYFLFEASSGCADASEAAGDVRRRRRSRTAAAFPATAPSRRRGSFTCGRGDFDRLSALRWAARGACRARVGIRRSSRRRRSKRPPQRRDADQRGGRLGGESVRDQRRAEEGEPRKRAGGSRPASRRQASSPRDRGERSRRLYGARGGHV